MSRDAFDPAAAGWAPYSEPGMTELVGPLWHRSDGELPRLGFIAGEKHGNRRGIAHGGMLLMLADHALGMAASQSQGRQPQATIQLNVQFVSSAEVGDFVEVDPEVVRRTRSLVFMQGVMRVNTRTVATVTGIWKIIGR